MSEQRSTQDVVKLTGITARTLRHYDQINLLAPSRISDGGQRWYDSDALVRLQRILMLRELGIGLGDIARVLDDVTAPADALATHADWLRAELVRLEKQLDSVTHTIDTLRQGERPMAERMFEGFDHTQYREEVEKRWGSGAYETSDQWWRAKSDSEKTEFTRNAARLAEDWAAAAASGTDPESPVAQHLAARQWDCVTAVPGTPGYRGSEGEQRQYFEGLGEMYVADDRFAANYGGAVGAQFVRDAMVAFVERMPSG